jgi:hypothetical protein
MLRAIVVSAVLLLGPLPAGAGDLLSPSGAPWWRRLAECGGVTLAARDRASEAHAAPKDVADLTRAVNAVLELARGRIMEDQGIAEAAAKKAVYRTAGARWMAVKADPALSAAKAACDRDIAGFKALKP